MMDFIAIDFETANGKQQAPCSLGITIVKNGEVKDCMSYLINPEAEFSSYNMDVHGIHPEEVSSSPTFGQLFLALYPLLKHYPVVAHNVTFDRNVLEKAAHRYHLNLPPITWYCTMQLCAENYVMDHYRLDTVCKNLGISLESHHSCDCDSLCCAKIMLHLLDDENTFIHDVNQPGIRMRAAASENQSPKSPAVDFSANQQSFGVPTLHYVEDAVPMEGRSVAITGNIPGYERDELIQYIQQQGGIFKSGVSRKTDYLIVGYEDLSLVADKVTFKSSKIIHAEQLISSGYAIQFISGETFAKHIKQSEGK